MDFQTFAKSGRVTECLVSEEALGLPDCYKGIAGVVFAGNVFFEFIDDSIGNGVRAEIGSECIESDDVMEVVQALYDFACEEGLLEGVK